MVGLGRYQVERRGLSTRLEIVKINKIIPKIEKFDIISGGKIGSNHYHKRI